MENYKKISLGLLASLLFTQHAYATEGGQNAAPVGVNTVLPGILPAPGHSVYLDYFQFYNADTNANGTGKNSVPDFSAKTIINASRFLYTWKPGFDGFHITSGFILPIVLQASVSTETRKGRNGGLADITLQPLAVSYVALQRHLFTWAGVDIFVPTGQYSKTNMVNIGRNYFTFSPDFNLTYLASSRLQLSFHAQIEFHTTNQVTDYHSGDLGFASSAVDYVMFPNIPRLHFGLQGYALKQFTDDTQYGEVFKNGYRGQAFAVGPQIRWDWSHGGIALKWQHEFLVRNRTKGDRIWVQFALPMS